MENQYPRDHYIANKDKWPAVVIIIFDIDTSVIDHQKNQKEDFLVH